MDVDPKDDGPRTLAIRNLPDWVDEHYLYQLFLPTKAVVTVKMSKIPSATVGKHAHMTMESHEKAAGCMQAYNGRAPPNVTGWTLDIDWASEAMPTHEVESTVSANLEIYQAGSFVGAFLAQRSVLQYTVGAVCGRVAHLSLRILRIFHHLKDFLPDTWRIDRS
jgi:hypothetical protein